MFKQKTLWLWAMIISTLFSCGSSQPARTNVLAKPSSQPPQKTTSKSPQHHTGKPALPVYTQPEQVTRRDRNSNNSDVSSAPQSNKPEPVVYTPAASTEARPAYRSPAYFRLITDSIQQVSARPLHTRMMDSLTNIISKVRNPKNPAVNAADWYATVNFNVRKPNFVILHHTAQSSAEQTLFTFSITRTSVSAHYVVGRDGVIYQMLNDYMRAWHAGNSRWGAITDMNSCSLGIEIDNNGEEPFSDAQINALITLLGFLKKEYDIPQANFIAHSDIAPSRKNDPSKFFPWKKLADAGFGYWYDSYNMITPPADFNAILALRVIGYDTRNQAKAIQAFKLHYIQNDTSPTLSDYDKKVLYNIYSNY